MHNTRYIIVFVAILTLVVALILSLMATGLQPIHDRNEAVYNKKAILSAIETTMGVEAASLGADQVQDIFDEQIEQVVVDMQGNIIEGLKAEEVDLAQERKKPVASRRLPVYIYNGAQGKVYILSVRGSGLWDEIWGSIAVEDDFSTIVGAAFDHAGETPGLGAEIKDNPNFSAQFEGKKLYEPDGDYTGIVVRKGGAKDPMHEVDGISGATITGDGVTQMIQTGIEYYEPYFEKVGK